MSGFLFSDIIFGPVKSRRLGVSLGINLLPTEQKFCSFNCIYCECGWNPENIKKDIKLPGRQEIYELLEKKLIELKNINLIPDAFTFAGNGEPTIHPEFDLIVKDTIALRNKYFPDAKTTVLSNASMIHKDKTFEALKLVDKNILKLDTGSQEQFERICQAHAKMQIEDLVDYLCKFHGELIIQTLFLRGEYNGYIIDNTTDYEVGLWLEHLKKITPKSVMIYSIDRSTPAKNLEKISREELNKIADKVHKIGLKTEVY